MLTPCDPEMELPKLFFLLRLGHINCVSGSGSRVFSVSQDDGRMRSNWMIDMHDFV